MPKTTKTNKTKAKAQGKSTQADKTVQTQSNTCKGSDRKFSQWPFI